MEKKNTINKKNNKTKTTKIIKDAANKIAAQKLKGASHPNISNLTKNFNKLSTKGVQRKGNYESALLLPEMAIDAKVPLQFGLNTVSLHRHISIPISTNVLGAACLLINPCFVRDATSTLSTVAFCNAATYNATSVYPDGSFLNVDFQIPGTNVSGYRVVSMSSTVIPQSSNLNVQGKITGGIINMGGSSIFPTAAGAVNPHTASYGNLAYVDNIIGSVVANVGQQSGVRMIYTPIDVEDLELFPINTNENIENANGIMPLHNYVISGANGVQPFTIELYYNIECTVRQDSIMNGMGKMCTDLSDPRVVLQHIKSDPQLLCHVTRGIRPLLSNQTYNPFPAYGSNRRIKLDDFNEL